jgi:hypothetical protein
MFEYIFIINCIAETSLELQCSDNHNNMEVFLMKPKNLPVNENASYKSHKGSETTSVINGMNISYR